MSFNQLTQIPLSITGVFQGLRLYPSNHPQIRKQLENSLMILQKQLAKREKLTIGLVDDTLFINGIPCIEQISALQELAGHLDRQEIQLLEIFPTLDNDQLLNFCQLLRNDQNEDFQACLEAAGITAFRASRAGNELEGVETIYKMALKTVAELCEDVRLGHLPSSRNLIGTVKKMVRTMVDEPYALLAMAMLKDYDNYTFCHSVNVAVIAMSVGKACGLSHQEIYELGVGGLLHDLGKMTIDHQIVAKPGKLSAAELEVMKQHPSNGARIVADMAQIPSSAIDIVTGHHLRYDRTGYPDDSRGSALSPLTDMAGIADTYDAMTTMRCYQRPRSPRQAIEMMKELSGTQLHPEFLEKFLNYLGPYPVGTLVRLKNGTIGLVCDQNQQQVGSLNVKILFDFEGNLQAAPELIELADASKIVAEVDPALKGIRLEDYLPTA